MTSENVGTRDFQPPGVTEPALGGCAAKLRRVQSGKGAVDNGDPVVRNSPSGTYTGRRTICDQMFPDDSAVHVKSTKLSGSALCKRRNRDYSAMTQVSFSE